HCEVGRPRTVRVVRLEGIRGRKLRSGAVEVLDPCCHRAICIQRRTEAVGLRLALERRLMRPAEYGAGDRMLHDDELYRRLLSFHTHGNLVLTWLQILEPRKIRRSFTGAFQLRVSGASIDDHDDVVRA